MHLVLVFPVEYDLSRGERGQGDEVGKHRGNEEKQAESLREQLF